MSDYQNVVYAKQHQGKFINVLKGRCPRCGEGKFFESANPYNFKTMLSNRKECSHCHLNFVPELGFYWGATYVSYMLTVAFSVFTFAVSAFVFGFMNSLNLYYVAVNAVLLFILCPVSFRFSRILWLWLFYDRDNG